MPQQEGLFPHQKLSMSKWEGVTLPGSSCDRQGNRGPRGAVTCPRLNESWKAGVLAAAGHMLSCRVGLWSDEKQTWPEG